MQNVLLTAGIACVMAAIVGGGLKAFGIDIPILHSTRRQIMLAGFGLVLLVLTYLSTDRPKGGDPPQTIPALQPGYDFVLQASKARWSNGSKLVPYPGNRGSSDGFVYYGSYDVLEDGKTSESYLEMHPEWVSHGVIQGEYGPFRIGRGLKISCHVRFFGRSFRNRRGDLSCRVYEQRQHGKTSIIRKPRRL